MTDDAATISAPKPQQTGSRKFLLFVRDLVFILLAALVISFVIKTFFIRSFYIPSPSMTNTLQVNDRIIVSLLTPGLTPLKRGDVVVFEDPGGWDSIKPPKGSDSPVTNALAFVGLTAPTDTNHLVKRVIGLPGDHVTCCNAAGKLTVNGIPITEPFVNKSAGQPDDPYSFNVTVPAGHLWVMGDNRFNSEDSAWHNRYHDVSPYLPERDVTGRAMLISWPASRWTYLTDYPDDFSRVESAK